MEVSSELLRAHRLGGQLQEEIAAKVEQLQPALACELVALPLQRFQVSSSGQFSGDWPCGCTMLTFSQLAMGGLLRLVPSCPGQSPVSAVLSRCTSPAPRTPEQLGGHLPKLALMMHPLPEGARAGHCACTGPADQRQRGGPAGHAEAAVPGRAQQVPDGS